MTIFTNQLLNIIFTKSKSFYKILISILSYLFLCTFSLFIDRFLNNSYLKKDDTGGNPKIGKFNSGYDACKINSVKSLS